MGLTPDNHQPEAGGPAHDSWPRRVTALPQEMKNGGGLLWARSLLILGLALAPFVFLVVPVIRYGVDLPYSDQWAFVWFLRRAYEGTLSLHDLWLPHNEHRMLFPRIVFLALARLSGWNISYELAANIVLATGILAVLLHQTRSTSSSLGARGAGFLIPALSLTVFSLKQADNWLWGLQLSFFLNALAVVSGIIALAMPAFRWWRFLAAVFLGVVASYSTANGLLYWFVALPVLFALPRGRRNTKRLCRAIWLLAAAATIGSYLYDYHGSDAGAAVASILGHPLDHVTYVLCYLGNPVGPNHILATCLAGALGLLALLVTGLLLVRSRHLTPGALAPYYSLALYSLGSACLTSVGRASLGALQAKVSRYVTMASPLWIAVLVLLYLLFRASVLEARAQDARRRGRRAVAGAALAAFAAVVLAVGRSSVKALPVFQDWHAKLAPARAELLSGGYPELLRDPFPGVDLMAETAFLKEHRLSVFRDR